MLFQGLVFCFLALICDKVVETHSRSDEVEKSIWNRWSRCRYRGRRRLVYSCRVWDVDLVKGFSDLIFGVFSYR